MKILGIITARGGSKGIPRKNLTLLADQPLITHTLKAAKNSKLLDRVILSTDSKDIADIVKHTGIEVPFMRPKAISKDTTSSLEVINHTLNFLAKESAYIPDIIVLLQPTSPLRPKSLIDKSIKLLQNSSSSSVISVTKIKSHPYMTFSYDKNFLKPFKKNFQRYYRRQMFSQLYYPTGAIYTFWYKTLKKYNSFYGPKIKPIITSYEESIDIDSLFDLFVCEMTIKHWQNYLKRFKKN